MRKMLLATAAAAAVGLAATTADAALFVRAFVDPDGAGGLGFTQLGATQSNDGTVPLLSNFANALYNVSTTVTGGPLVPAPALTGATTTVEASANGIVMIEISQTDVPASSAGALANTFTTNFLVGQDGVTSVSIANYIDDANIAFSLATPLASATFLGSGNAVQDSGPVDVGISVTGLFSETMVFTIAFNGITGVSAVQANSQIAAVPEPASIALLGAGLLGLAGLTRGRRKAA